MKMMLLFSIIAAVCVNATFKRKRKVKKNPIIQTKVEKQTLPKLKSKSDEVDKYISEHCSNENSPEHLGHVKELNNESNYFVENRLLLPNPVFKTILEGLRPGEIVILAQMCKKLLFKIISIKSYQYVRVEGVDGIPQNISDELKKRKIRHHPNWNVIIFNPNINLPKEQQTSGDFILAVVNAKFLKYFRFPKGNNKYDLENDKIFLCQLNEGISYIVIGKVFSKTLTNKINEISGYVILKTMPIQVSDDRERQVVFFISNGGEGTYDIGALNASFNPKLQDIRSYNSELNLEWVRRGFNNDKVKNILVQGLKKDQN